MSPRRRSTRWSTGWVGIAAACLLAISGCGDDDNKSGGTPRPTSTPVSTNTPGAPTATGGAATATPTPTGTPVQVEGSYAATLDLDDGQEAHLNLDVASNGTATGTLEIVDDDAALTRTSHAIVVHNVSISVGLVSLSGSIDPSSRSFQFSGTIAAPGGPIAFELSGTLPDAGGGSGSVTLVVDGETYTSTLSRGAGPTPLPTEPGATPTPADGCAAGRGDVTFSNVSGVNSNQPLDSLHLDEAEAMRNMIGSTLFILGGKGGNCPIPVNGVVRLIDFSASNASDFVTGATFELGEIVIGQPFATLNYREATTAPSQQIWKAESGTFEIESFDGETLRVRITGAQMVPGAPFLFGPPPLGTFTLDGTLTVDQVM